MPDIRIHRDHALGLQRAREIARRWVADVEARFGVVCTVHEAEHGDTVTFARPGLNARLDVAADRFSFDARLGLLMGAFAKTIEAAIEKRLDALLAADALPNEAVAAHKNVMK